MDGDSDLADGSHDENSDVEYDNIYPYTSKRLIRRTDTEITLTPPGSDSTECAENDDSILIEKHRLPVEPNVMLEQGRPIVNGRQSDSDAEYGPVNSNVTAYDQGTYQYQKPDLKLRLFPELERHGSTSSILDGLLCEIYDRCHTFHGHKGIWGSADSDGFTEYSSNSEAAYHSSKGDSFQESKRIPRPILQGKSIEELEVMVRDLKHANAVLSGRLVKQLKKRDHNLAKLNKNQDVLTAILQAVSQKRREDAQLKFSIQPYPGKRAFRQWYDALRSMARIPFGIPPEFRRKVWLSLADRHVRHLKVDWQKTVRFAFNDRSNPDDDKLGVQIVKDLHRTGCSGFCGHDAEEDRVVLKRVLLAYARWNKAVGYCQGFNVIAALILEVMDRIEDDAFKVMIFLIDHVLPDNYFSNNLRALSVDMAVFRELLHFKMPELAQHLDRLQKAANDSISGSYEPPLTNVFTMQWFLTLFATCLPKALVLRVWDSLFMEGSEILLRTALAIWSKLEKRLMLVQSADEFYSRMGVLTNKMLRGQTLDEDDLIQTIYDMAPFPFPHLNEIREKYMFSITPFSPMGSLEKSPKENPMNLKKDKGRQSDEEVDWDEDDLTAVNCFTGFFPMPVSPQRRIEGGDRYDPSNDVAKVSPGAFGAASDDLISQQSAAMLERMNLDVQSLKKQYWRIQRRQMQAHVVYGPGGKAEQKKGPKTKQKPSTKVLAAAIETPAVINHLLIGKHGLGDKNAKVTLGPQIAPPQIQSFENEEKRRRAQVNVKPNVKKTPKSLSASKTYRNSHKISHYESNNWPPPSKNQLAIAEGLAPSSLGSSTNSLNSSIEDTENRSLSLNKLRKSFSESKAGSKPSSVKDWEDVDLSGSDRPNSPNLIDFGEEKKEKLENEKNKVLSKVNSHTESSLESSIVHPEVKHHLKKDHGDENSLSNAFSASPDLPKEPISSVAELEEEANNNKSVNDITVDFNCSFEAFNPEIAATVVSKTSAITFQNHSSKKKPWIEEGEGMFIDSHHKIQSLSSSSNSGYARSRLDSSSSDNSCSSPVSAPLSGFNPFPVRRLKGKEERNKTKMKVGLINSS